MGMWEAGARIIVPAALLGVVAAVCASCATDRPEGPGVVAGPGPSTTRDRGTYHGRIFAATRIDPKPPAAPARRVTPAFQTPYGDVVALAPQEFGETSVAGRPLQYWVLGDGPENVLVIGGIHGDEHSSAQVAWDLLVHAARHPEWLAGRRLVIAPEVNPDGLARGTRRNERDVNLNRNFPADNWSDNRASHGPGRHPGSEPETRFVLALLESYPPRRVVAAHAAAACVNWDGPAEELARRMGASCGLPPKSSIGYPTPGSLGSLLGVDQRVPTITLELADKGDVVLDLADYRRAILTAVCYPSPAPAIAGGERGLAATPAKALPRR